MKGCMWIMIFDITIIKKNNNIIKYELLSEKEIESIKNGLNNNFVFLKDRAINTDEITGVVFEELVLEQLLDEGRISENDIHRYF
ncbi:hypothetical protein [Bacillus cereus]|uniref:hypothetical protein n=1 Tax=Bacillus cereus TaxID=1396 RepID=UPI0005A46AB5|nr:hypothetical protein [Bacillus cereus]